MAWLAIALVSVALAGNELEVWSFGTVDVAEPVADGVWVAANATNSWWVTDSAGIPLGVGAVDLTTANVDDDAHVEVLLCTDRGVLVRQQDGTEQPPLTESPCGALVRVSSSPATIAASGPDGVARVFVYKDGKMQEAASQAGPAGTPLLAVHGVAVVLSAVGAEHLLVWRAEGTARVASQGPVAGIGVADNVIVWTTADGHLRAEDGTDRLILPNPGPPMAIWDGDPESTLVIPHPGLLGRMRSDGLERATRLPGALVAILDVDGDGCMDFVLREGLVRDACVVGAAHQPAPFVPPGGLTAPAPAPVARTVTILPTRPGPEQAAKREAALDELPKASLLGLTLRTWQRSDGRLASGFDPVRRWITVGAGLAGGGMPGGGRLMIGGSPIVVLSSEWGSGPVRGFLGADTAPIFLWTDGGDFFGIHLANLTGGAMAGGAHFRVGGFATLGLIAAGSGVRVVWTPWERPNGALLGLELRTTYFVPNVGQVSVMGVQSIPMWRSMREHQPWKPLPALFVTRRFGMSVGGAVDVSATTLSWETLGDAGNLDVRPSPALSLGVETGTRSASGVFTVNSAPLAVWHSLDPNEIDADRPLHHIGSVSLGAMFGGDGLRAGLVGTAGIFTLGGGPRIVVSPGQKDKKAKHGVEIRATGLWPSVGAGEAMVMYHVWMDPRWRDPDPHAVPPE